VWCRERGHQVEPVPELLRLYRAREQYSALTFGGRCREAGVRPSMGSVGDAYDNAMCESFFATLECELLARRRFISQAEARMAIFSYIEGWYIPPVAIPASAIYPQSPTRRRCARKPKPPNRQTVHRTGSTPPTRNAGRLRRSDSDVLPAYLGKTGLPRLGWLRIAGCPFQQPTQHGGLPAYLGKSPFPIGGWRKLQRSREPGSSPRSTNYR
jgi:hypothetical protein